jgi:hypothetical protein
MRSATEPAVISLPLEPGAQIERPLSSIEYYHASAGRSGPIRQTTREVVIVLEGVGPRFEPQMWHGALARASAENPGSRLRMIGKRWRACWLNDGQPPRLRLVENSDWDGLSNDGAGFINARPLSLEGTPTVELILVNNSLGRRFVVLRTLHAVMDGRSCLHFLLELFRALRGEPLAGSNAGFSDVDLMRYLGPRKTTSRHVRTAWLTGVPQGDEPGDTWQVVTLDTTSQNILARVASVLAEYCHQHSSQPALFAVPVDLRRRLPGLRSTTNFSSMLLIPLKKGEGKEAFRQQLGSMIEEKMDLHWPRLLDLAKLFSLEGLDRFLSRISQKPPERPLETAVISNLGRLDPDGFSCVHFQVRRLFLVPLVNCVYVSIVSLGDRVELAVGMQKFLAGNGRFERLVAHLQQRLADSG